MTSKRMSMKVDIFGYESVYQIDKQGNIYRKKTNKLLKINGYGEYYRIGLCLNGKQKYHSVHRLLAMAFIPNPESKPEVNHKDGNKKNNNLSNLEWVTKSENRKHAYDIGIQKSGTIGEKHWNSKLNKCSVKIIRLVYNFDGITQKEIAKAFNVDRITIQNIIKGTRWKEATE